MPRQETYLCRIDQWEAKLNQSRKSPYTVASYTAAARLARRILMENGIQTAPKKLSQEDIELIYRNLHNSAYKMGVKDFLRFVENPYVERADTGPAPKCMNKADWLDRDTDEDRIVWETAMNSPLFEKVIVHFELHLGMRRGGCKRLLMSYYLGRHMIVLEKGREGGKFRTIPVHPFTKDIMREVKDFRADTLEPHAFRNGLKVPEKVIAWPNHHKITTPSDNTLNILLKNVSRKAGIEFSHHTLRRTCARNLYLEMVERGKVNLAAIQRFLGHESMEMTVKYLGINMVDMEEMMSIGSQRFQKPINSPDCTETPVASL